MPLYTIAPTGFAYSGNWSAYRNAYDGFTYQKNAAADTAWLGIEFAPAIPSDWTIVGAVLRFTAGVVIPPNYIIPFLGYGQVRTLQAALGTSSAGITGLMLRSTQAQGNLGVLDPYTLGAMDDQWGITLTPSLLNDPAFRVFVQRGTSSAEDNTTDRFAISWYLDVYYTVGETFTNPMGIRASVHQSTWFGKETIPGTAVATPNLLVASELQIFPKPFMKERRTMGDKLARGQNYLYEESELSLSGDPTYNEMVYLMSTLVSKPASQVLPGSATAYQHSLKLNSRAVDAINTLTVTTGDSNQCEQAAFCFLSDLGIKFDFKDVTLSGSGFGQKLNTTVTQPVGANEVQTLTFGGSPSGGSFILGFRGLQTAAINWNATPATLATNIQTALNALADIGAAGVAVSGTGPFTVTFNGTSVAGSRQELLQVINNSLTGTSPTLTAAETTPGGYLEMQQVPILPGNVTFSLANSFAGLGAGALTRLQTCELQLSGKSKPAYFMSATNSSTFSNYIEDAAKLTIKVVAEAGSETFGVFADMRVGQRKYFRVVSTSPQLIDGTNPFLFQADVACMISAIEKFEDHEGIYALSYALSASYDETAGYSANFLFQNDIASY